MSDDLQTLGKQLPYDRPDDARRDAVRASLLAAASQPEPRTRWGIVAGAFAMGAVAAAATVLLVVRRDEPAPELEAKIEASPAAQFERQVTRTSRGVDEVVRVHDGKLAVSVGAIARDDRMRVVTKDAEVEGEGRYEVIATADEIQEVSVTQGRVTVRVQGQHAIFLATGETWRAKAVATRDDLQHVGADPMSAPDPISAPDRLAAPAAPTAAPVVEPMPAPTPAPTPKPARIVEPTPAPHVAETPKPARVVEAPAVDDTPAPTPDVVQPEPAKPVTALAPEPKPDAKLTMEQHFKLGWSMLKANSPAEAARELGAAADAGGDDPLALDARYFQAVALTKAGRKTEAEAALVAFIDHAPTSIRRGRAQVMLGRLIAERGNAKAARAWFEAALVDKDASVVAAARAGLAALK